MLSRLATVLQELSGEEAPDGDPQDGLVPQVLPGEEQDPVGTQVSEEAMERLAHLEPLVFQLKELIREKDGQLAQKDADLVSKDAQLKNERETAETRFTKLKLQAKAKMASLTKQISELKGQEGITSPDSSFTGSGGAAEEELKNKLLEEEANSRALQEHLNTTQQLLQDKETAHAEQLRVLQTVVFEKDVRFQEQVQKHEDELLRVTMQSHSDTELQQALQTSQRRCEELEEAIRSRSQVLEMLQQELNSADQQKQILTAQFRQMEQELAEGARQREEDQQKWAQQATRTEEELETLRAENEFLDREKTEVAEQLRDMTNTREAEQAAFIARGEAFEKEMMEEVARLESELDSVKEAEFAAVQASRDATERDGMEIARLETELASVNEKLELAAAHAVQENMEREIVEIDTLQNEIASLREEQGKSQKRDETLAEVWRRLHALALEDVHESEEESPVPTDLSPFLGTLQSLEAQLMRLREERDKYEERCAQVTHSMEVVQEQLNRSTSECEEAVAKIQHLEQEIGTLSEPLGQDVIEPAVPETSDAAKAQILALEQRLLEKDNELATLKECLLLAKEQSSEGATEDICDQTPEQDHDAIRASCDSPLALPDLVEDTPEEETTLVAEDTSVCADNESSPELIGRQSESPGESKGASSDEMVTSSDSEVAHSSWTLLEAVNQESSQEWPSIIQDFGQLQLQSWEETSMEQETSTVQVASSSVVIRETVHVQLTQQGASTTDSNFPPGQVFAQALADELQKRYSELLAELQRLRETSAESQEKIHSLEEEKQLLVAVKEEMESMVQNFKEELSEARDEMHKLSQQCSSVEEKHVVEIHLLEEQLNILNAESETKEQRIKAMQTDLDAVQQALSEQEGHARMLSAQLEDRELLSSDLERKLQDMENSLLEYSQTTDLNNTSLSEKNSEISELQLRVMQKDQEMMELNDGMSAKLLQAGEEKFMISSEVKKLKEQISELENVRSGQQEVKDEGLVDVYDELATLRKDKEELTTQLANLKKKCQAALVQRKELMKKVADFEEEAKKWKGQDGKATVETPVNIPEVEKPRAKEIQEMETVLEEVRQTLRSKEEAVRSLEQRIGEQEQILSETLVQNKKLSEEAQQTDNTEMTELQSHVASLEAECETLQKKLLEAQQARKETIRKAKEKDRHHREQLKQQKEEYNELLERFEKQDGEREFLVTKLRELEEQQAQRDVITEKEVLPHQETVALTETQEKPAAGDWVQEDWVDFSESDSAHQQCDKPIGPPVEQPLGPSAEKNGCLQTLTEEDQAVQMTCKQLEFQLQQTQASLSLKETELINLGKELDSQKAKEQQIDVLLEEMDSLREKCRQAESYAETLKKEVEAAAGAMSAEASVVSLQAEMEEFKQFLDNKNREIIELSQQLSEQNTLLRSMQDTVFEKDQLIASLQEGLMAEQEKVQRLEAVVPQKQKGEKDNEAKIQQLQRKLQAALISRKEALKESKAQKEALASTEKLIAELQQNVDLKECELEKLRVERVRLIEEVDRTLLENQSLGSSCESLKLAMEGIITEKDACKREAEFAKEEAARNCREYEDKVQGMKDEYETLLKSYENVSDEAERVRRVLEAARQERQELAARVRAHEVARQEAQQQAEEAQKEVDSIKDKMRKFAKTKQQKILELEEENERLREVEEKKTVRRDDRALKAELERLQEELGNFNADLDSIKAERDCLQQQVAELKEELAHKVEKRSQISPTSSSSEVVVEESVVAQQTCSVMAETSQDERESNSEEQPEAIEQAPSEEVVSLSAPETQLQSTEERSMETNKDNQIVLEGKIREMEAELGAERELRQEQEATLKAELGSLQKQLQECKETEQSLVNSLQQCLQESKDKEQSFMEEMSKREAHFKELRSSLEGEKDDLEERLMNQLAQLNGSIAGYQQESTDSRERMAELQREVEGLETERAELEAETLSEKDRAARLEEDKRQAQRERDEAEAQSGKQRELEQQLKSAQRVKEGSQSRTRQLEELLREKQLEVRQMQRDCIKYQERISELGREAKALQLAHDELHRELEFSHAETSKTLEEMKRTESDLVGCKSQLEDAQKQASQALSEKTVSEQAALQREASIKAEAEQTLDSVRFRLGAELKQVELRLEDAYREREKEEEATLEARNMAASAEKRAQEMQARLDESLARLAAFSRCMSSLQDDRDRVLDETRQWETRFNSTLQGKESEVREAETRVKELAEQLQKETTQREELQLSVDRLLKVDKDWVLRMDEEEKKLRETMAVLEEKKGKLEQAMAQIQSTQAEASTLESEVEGLRNRVRALEEAVGRLQGEADQARTELREREAEERRLCLTVEQLETDLRSSKALTESLQTELSEKERREVELLGEKEQAVTQAAEEARREADSRAQEAETELEQRREELRDLEAKLQKAKEDGNHSKARLDSFTKAMGSLQDDRDRVLNMYKQLEEKHLQVMMEKDALIQEAAGENNSLKEELRSLLVQRDDLYAEKAKLAAQLHGYREELNQVLSMKESQHRKLLAAQRERITSLESECDALETQVKNLSGDREVEAGAVLGRVERETLSQTSDSVRVQQTRDAPGAEVEKLREQLQAAREQAEALEYNVQHQREEQASKAKELAELRWEGGVMRTESESAQERVAELARDLMVIEQKLVEEKEVTAELRAENQSFGKAMASLQDSRDQAVNKAQELSLRLDEMSKAVALPALSSPGGSTGEVWGLKNALQALQNDRERLLEQLQQQTSELQRKKLELARLGAGELIKVSQELFEERTKAEETLSIIKQLEDMVEMGKQDIETLQLERIDWMAQAEQLKQQTLATLSERDQQLRQLTAMLEEAQAPKPKLLQEHYQRQGTEEVDSAPGAPQERSSSLEGHTYIAEVKELQRRLDEETQQRMLIEEQLMASQDLLKRYTQGEWQAAHEGQHSETAVLIEPPEGVVTRSRRGGPGLMRMLRVAFCSRQRTPLLFSLYLLTVHVLLLLCLGGYL